MRWWMAVIAALVIVYWWHQRPARDAEPAWEATTQSTPKPTSPTRSTSRAQLPLQPRTSAPVPPPPQMQVISAPPPGSGMSYSKQGLVHFKMVDGLAIAFGDVILGKPVGQENIQQGFFKPPKAQPWKAIAIPYAISPDLPNPDRVQQAIDYFHQFTPVSFVPFRGEKDAIVFEPASELCLSYVGRIGGHQPIRLGPSCTWVETLHEIMHALGFVHEHSRTDRDQFVLVNWDNIEETFKNQFAQVPEQMMGPQSGTPFDYQSIMIYPPEAFQRSSSEPTLRSLSDEPIQPAQSGLSPQDIERLNKIYGVKEN